MNTLNCPGDGVTDVTRDIQQQIDYTPPGGELYIPAPAVSYLVSAPITINKPISILGEQSTLQMGKPATGLFQITSSGVTLAGLCLRGNQFKDQNAAEVAIQASGASAKYPLLDLVITDCEIENWGMYGLIAKYVEGFAFGGNVIRDTWYAGIMGLSVLNGEVGHNKIVNIIGTPNAYGIAMTRLTTDPGELVTNPCSSNVSIYRNEVVGVANWEGIDTHAGRKISITDNRIYGCGRGVAVVDCPNSSNVATYGPKDCIVSGNVIDSGKSDGSAVYGITVSGCSSAVGVPTDLAEGCVVSGNVIRGYGFQGNALGMAVYLVSTRGLVVTWNTIIEPGKCGIGLYHTNYGFAITGNVVQDPWSLTQQAVAISAISDHNKGFVGNNSYVRGSKVAARVLEVGFNVNNFPNIAIKVTKDYADSAFPLYDPGKRTS